MYLGLCVLSILGVSASTMLQPRNKRFQFTRSQYRRFDECQLCYDGDCLPLDQTRCDYYEEVNSFLQRDDEDPEGIRDDSLRNEVDKLFFDIVEKAALTPELECIPYISRYTDCNKENVCTGCKICSCTSEGKWNCNSSTHCRIQEPALDINHRILSMAIENLLGETKSPRIKRSVTKSSLDAVVDAMTIEDITDLFYRTKPLRTPTDSIKQEDSPVTDNIKKEDTNSLHEDQLVVPSEFLGTGNTETDYLAFDEVLRNIDVDTKTNTRRKLPIKLEASNKSIEFDYMLLDDEGNVANENTTDNVTEISYVVNYMNADGSTENPIEESTKIVIDLLESAKPSFSIFNETDFAGFGINKEDLVDHTFDSNNDIVDFNMMTIRKRDVNNILATNKAPNATNTAKLQFVNITNIENKITSTEKSPNLKDDVLYPIIKVINSKVNDIQNLKIVKENLINFMNNNNQSPIVEIIDYPDISASSLLHDIEMFPDIGYDLRRTNPDLRQKFLFKLKSDIYEVIKDILALQRYRKGDLPDDLNFLIHYLKRYVSRTKPNKRRNKNKSIKTYRRNYDPNTSKCFESTFKQCMIEVLQVIDKDMPKLNALGALSPVTRRIMRHVLRTLYTDEVSSLGLKVHDPSYNMADDLNSIGSKWEDINNIVGSSPFITLYRMKLIHYFLEMDVNKLNDALTLLAFAHSRRMTPYFKTVQNNVMERINDGLNSVHNKVEIVVKYYSKKPKEDENPALVLRGRYVTTESTINEQITTSNEQHHENKRSFIKYIRNLLKSSKRDVHELLHRQVPKSEIVKQLARKKLDELAEKRYNEYEEAMRRWQKNLGVMTRYKRNADELSNRIKSIIPRYLRHKVKPKLHKKKKNGTSRPEKKGNRKKKQRARQNKQKKTTLTTAMNPKIKAISALTTKMTTAKPKQRKAASKSHKAVKIKL